MRLVFPNSILPSTQALISSHPAFDPNQLAMNRFNGIVFTGTKKLIPMGGLDCFRTSGLHKSIRNYNITCKTFSRTHQHLLF